MREFGKMKNTKSIVVAVIAFVVAAAYAAPASSAFAQSSSALSIVPKKNYVIESGKSVKDKLSIRNLDASRDLELTLKVVDFSYTDDGGTPKLFLDSSAPQTTWSLRPYLKVPETVVVPKGSTKTVDMSVAIPNGHGAGSYYSAIVYSSGTPSGGGNVGLSASGVTLVFTQIPGKVNEDLKLQRLGAYKNATPTTAAHYVSVATEEPQLIAYTLKNEGNVTEAPAGSITLKGWFGSPITINNVNPSGSLALIGQTRTYTACIKLKETEVNFSGQLSQASGCVSPGLLPGPYTVTLDLYYGQNGNNTREVTGVTTFWYLPWWFIIVFTLVLLVVAYFTWRTVRWVRAKFGIAPSSRSRRR